MKWNSQLTQSAISGLALDVRRSWTHSLLPFSDAMYKAVCPSCTYVKGQIKIADIESVSKQHFIRYKGVMSLCC